ncbi:COP23 domain-containing protein [Crocosphaera sp. XPORK-15E]|uniref:COP23 domain-containing protein n=1 Tax=Crocosphaera sp. XPORK-15E TaxID=3110247 RepID=UPI002B21B4FA|nr:COP23 domain-containing protein [Crocosphaera sp. XPORK-15E]MEA5533352.1 COP23 domain-containing protein [Crocosphaera sp. XPORK-15E]
MKTLCSKKTSLAIIATGIFTTLIGVTSPSYAQSVQFECATDEKNIPTTYAQTEGGIVQIFKWTSTFFNPPYTPIQRCQEVAKRLNQFQPDHLVAGKVNNYQVICAGNDCDPNGSNILLTLKPNQDPAQVLAEIDNTRDAAGGPSMQLGGSSNGQRNPQKNSNLERTRNGSVSLNLRGYIQSAPKIPLNLSGGANTNNNSNISPDLNQQPITVPSNTGKPPSSSRGRAW